MTSEGQKFVPAGETLILVENVKRMAVFGEGAVMTGLLDFLRDHMAATPVDRLEHQQGM